MNQERKTLAVFSLKSGRNGTIWVRAGQAELNADGSLNLTLDVLPLDGRLHVRESFERGLKESVLPH
jgi:hypothetical protein